MTFEDELMAAYPVLKIEGRKFVRTHAELEDLIQATIVRCLERKKQFIPGPDSTVLKWSKKIMKNIGIDNYRSVSRRREILDDERPDNYNPGGSGSVFSSPEDSLESNDVLNFIGTLPPEHEEALILKGQGLTSFEIAERLGKPHGTVRRHLFEGRKALNQKFGDQ